MDFVLFLILLALYTGWVLALLQSDYNDIKEEELEDEDVHSSEG